MAQDDNPLDMRRTRELTAREREVLELVRAGLTNDEIAERLGITSDGVKYHVSQTLSKLGVSSRHEAVNAALAEARRRWWASGVASAVLKISGVSAALGGLAFVGILLWGVLRSDDSDVPTATEEVLASVERAVTRPGQVLHSRVEGVYAGGGRTSPKYTAEVWVDAENRTVRSNHRDTSAGAIEVTMIVEDGDVIILVEPDEAIRYDVDFTSCPGVELEWMSAFLLCGAQWGYAVPSPVGEQRVETGEFRGRSAIVIEFQTSVTTIATTTWRVYLDAVDYLPIAQTLYQSDGDGRDTGVEVVYENEFVPLDEEIETLLDPRSIGYVGGVGTPR